MKKFLSLFLIMILLGCGGGIGYIRVSTPTSSSSENRIGQKIFIKSVKDSRLFHDSSTSVDMQSLGFDDPKEATPEMRKRIVARWGSGHISLEESQTVESVVKDSFILALLNLGYNIIDNEADLTNDTVIIEVRINKYWGWHIRRPFYHMNRGIIETGIISIKDGKVDKRYFVKAESSNSGTNSPKNYRVLFNRLMSTYIQEVMSSLQGDNI